MSPLSLDEARARFMDALEARIDAAIAPSGLLAEMSRYCFATGGKRIRALLPPWVSANLGGDPAAALPLGAGLEILHNATLVHDDLQDGDTHRRGRPTVWNRWGAAQAINVGDSLFFLGLAEVCAAPAGPVAMGPICEAMQRVVHGQVMEFQLQLPADRAEALPPSLDRVCEMATAKTGALFGACLMAGALAAGRPMGEARTWYNHGEALGLLFQVQDDYLDLVGDKGRDLKGSDIAEGKISFPVAWALEHAPAEAAAELLTIVRLPRAETGPEHIERALHLLEAHGALAATAAWLRQRRDDALGGPFAAAVPGLAERFLAPVVHAL